MAIGWPRRTEPRSLRTRLRRTLLLFGGTAAVLLALGAALLDESLEQLVIERTLQEAARASGEGGTPPSGAMIRRYGAGGATAPEALRDLASGFHEGVSMGSRTYYVYVAGPPQHHRVVAYDTTRLAARERWFYGLLGGGVLLMVLAAWWLGRVAADRLSRPLEELAGTLRALEPGATRVRLREDRRDVELGQIAAAFNGFLDRLDGFIEREQSFTRTVSHELRTPLSNIRLGVAALRGRVAPEGEAALGRVDRASASLGEMVDSLLALAREGSAGEEGPCDVAAVVREVVAGQEAAGLRGGVGLCVGRLDPLRVAASSRLVAVLVGNLVRNALQHTPAGRVTLAVEGRQLVVEDAGGGLPDQEPGELFRYGSRGAGPGTGHGLGLYIVGQVCDRYGWSVDLVGVDGGGVRATVDFGAPA